MVLVDEGKHMDNNHPMHMHGYNFRVVAMEKVNIYLLTVFDCRFFSIFSFITIVPDPDLSNGFKNCLGVFFCSWAIVLPSSMCDYWMIWD